MYRSRWEVQLIHNPTSFIDLAEAEILSVSMRDAKLVLLASWLRKAPGIIRVELIAVRPWICFRAATFKSSKSMVEQCYGSFTWEEGRRWYGDCVSGTSLECLLESLTFEFTYTRYALSFLLRVGRLKVGKLVRYETQVVSLILLILYHQIRF